MRALRMRESEQDVFLGTVREKGRITIPGPVREELGLEAGDVVLFALKDDRLEIVPGCVGSRDQVWFFAPPVRWRIRQAEIELATGAGLFVHSRRTLSRLIDNSVR